MFLLKFLPYKFWFSIKILFFINFFWNWLLCW